MTERPLPFVSVIVPVLNGERTLRACLGSLLTLDYPVERREILVVDNGSTDRTAEIIQRLPVRYLRETQRGAAAARNRGIAASRGAILAFTDADCVVTTGWLRELVRGFEDDGVGGVEGEIVAYPPVTSVQRYAARIGSHSRRQRLARVLPFFVLTANVAYRREVFQRIGLFDTRFSVAGEDADLSWRFSRERDLECGYACKAIVFHRHRATLWGLFTQRIGDGYGRALLHRKYPRENPWGWRQEAQAYWRLLRALRRATEVAFHRLFTDGEPAEIHDLFYDFIARLGYRIGFARGCLSRVSF